MKNKSIVITGAAGFIASCVVRHLNEQKITDLILVDDIERSDRWKNLQNKKFLDLISKNELFTFLEKRREEVSAIIHLGACSDTLETDGNFLMENNYRFSVRLAEYAIPSRIRFIYASSAATYGDGFLGFRDDHASLDLLKPLNLYGFSKHLFDLWLKRRGFLDRVVGLKYFNVYGPNESHKGHMSSMVYKMFPKAKKEGVIQLFQSSEPHRFADGDQCRDFIYVKDAAAMTCQFLENDLCGIFNIGLGQPTTWNTLAQAVFKAMDIQPQIEYIPMPENLKRQYQNYTCADMEKYYKSAKIAPLYTVDTAVKDYICNYLLQDERW